jgi:glycosyltransferase involved in cell wall biosynthesis
MIFPSRNEGLPMAMLEAQAAAVPIVASTRICAEIAALPDMVDFVDLDRGPVVWGNAVGRRLSEPPRMREDAVRRLLGSEFASQQSANRLFAVYRGIHRQSRAISANESGMQAGFRYAEVPAPAIVPNPDINGGVQ